MDEGYGKGYRILVVDDEPTVQQVLEALLTDEGFEVVLASNLEQAQEAASGQKIDLFLLDKNLPDGNGLELAKQIACSEEDCEVLVMTGYASMESVVDALRMRVADYIVKPFNSLGEVKERLHRTVDQLAFKRDHKQTLKQLRIKNKELESLAIRDPLTGLFNHAYFQEGLTRELSRSLRYLHPLGMIFIDVDNFKQVNDTLGHLAGDKVLKTIAEILRGSSRDVDYHFRLREHDIAARYGGDEFVLLLPETPKSGVAVTAERLRICVEDHVFGGDVPVTLSVGVAAFPDDGQSRDDLIQAADLALYAAKHSGRNRVITYSDTLKASGQKSEWESQIDIMRLSALQRTIAFKSIDFVYQPIVALETSAVIGYEALCRPRDENLDGPDGLIETAERAGRMTDVGRLLRELAIAPIGRLPAGASLFINLHPRELCDPKLLESSPALSSFAKRVVFEAIRVEEVEDFTRVIKILDQLRAAGFRVALDDLKPGYQGLDSLTVLEPDFLKVSMAAVHTAMSDERSARAFRHLMDFCAGEGIQVIAEQVETEADRDLVSQLGCPLLQGRLIGEESADFGKPDSG